MPTRLKHISALQVGRYQVYLETADRGITTSFVFMVEEGEIQVVKSPPEFVEHMKYQMEAAAPLMDAVLAFHRAQTLQISELTARCLPGRERHVRVERERGENALKNKRNSNLLICFKPTSPSIPLDPPIWQWIWH